MARPTETTPIIMGLDTRKFIENMKKKEGEPDILIEALAELEHKQWVHWSKVVAQKENISKERLKRWKELWIPYNELSDEMKEEDRKWARKILKIIWGEGINAIDDSQR